MLGRFQKNPEIDKKTRNQKTSKNTPPTSSLTLTQEFYFFAPPKKNITSFGRISRWPSF